MSQLDPREIARRAAEQWKQKAWIIQNRWVPHTPYERQQLFLDLRLREAFYGGAAGGG